MSALTYLDSNSDNKVYLFGIHASLLLFGLGLVELCKDNQEEGLEERISYGDEKVYFRSGNCI
jgi:hypothetical protein